MAGGTVGKTLIELEAVPRPRNGPNSFKESAAAPFVREPRTGHTASVNDLNLGRFSS